MRRILEFLALALLAAGVVLAAILVGRTPKTVMPAPTLAAKAAQTANASPAAKAQASLPCPPPPGTGVPGACTPKPVQVFGSRSAVPKVIPATVDPHVCIPDVSSYQGNVDWGAVKAWQLEHNCTPSGIFKMGEYVLDPYAWRNNDQLRQRGMWRAGYWFLRRTGCAHEGQQIVDEAHALGLRVIEEDDESPEAAGYDGCITAYVHARDSSIVTGEYASPGAYPGGSRSSNPAWIAAYGPAFPPAAPWGGPITAFQCTDGIFGCVTYIPGIGRDDASVDYGITKLGVGPVGPSHAQVAKWIRERGSSLHAYYASCPSHKPVLGLGTCGQFAWRVNHFQLLIDTAHGYFPRCFGPRRNLGAAVCQVVRPANAIRVRALGSTVRAEGKLGCESARGAVRNRTCDLLREREHHFRKVVAHDISVSRL